MSYTPADARAFERLLEIIREAPRYRVADHLGKAHLHRLLAEIGVAPNIQVIAALMRTPRWKAWLQDYEMVRGAAIVREAVEEHLAGEVARVMARDFQQAMRTGGDVPAVAGAALAKVVAPPQRDVEAGGLLDVAATMDRTLLTGSLANDNSAGPQVVMAEPPPPPQRSKDDDPADWSEVRSGGPDDDR